MSLQRKWIASPSFSSRSARARIIVVHTAEGARTIESLGSFFANRSNAVSSQTGIDDQPGIIGEYVKRENASWTQASFNSAAISTELCGFASWDLAEWNRHPVMLDNCRQWIAEECAAAGIPLLRIGASAAQGNGTGVCGHVDLGSRGGGHWDPGPSFPWDRVLGGGAVGPTPPPVPPGLNAAIVAIDSDDSGYTMAAADGGIFTFGTMFHGSAAETKLNAPIVGLALVPGGYWLAASDGGVFAFGAPQFYGSAGGTKLNAPVVGIAATPSGQGYWLAAADGGVFAFGDAPFHGSAGGMQLNAPVVGIARSGGGYVLAGADGGVFAFGCDFRGSAGSTKLNQPIVGIDAIADGSGYWLVGADGGVFCFGAASFAGSTGGIVLNWPAVGIAASKGGYYIGAADGGAFAFGAPFLGSVQG
jgi:hypothetical protein